MLNSNDLRLMYAERFSVNQAYRQRVWRVLSVNFFAQWIRPDATVLDLGAGYGEFINNVRAERRFAMDLNPDSGRYLSDQVTLLQHDCASRWPLENATLDVVFTSNFLEHLPDKRAMSATLAEAWRCLRPGGRLIAMGPNVKCVPGRYWDFFDHHIPLTEASLAEALTLSGFQLRRVVARFLPYTMVGSVEAPLVFIRAYLALPWLWRFLGQQFLVLASKPDGESALRR